MSHHIVAVAAALIAAAGPALRSQSLGDSPTVLHSYVQEMLLDIVARDAQHKLITNLRSEEIEILDGVPQTLRSFQYRNGHEEPTGNTAAFSHGVGNRSFGALGQINVVSLVFEGLGVGGRPEAIRAARDFLGSAAGPDTYIGVFRLDQHLKLLQQYTNNLKLLKAANGPYLQSAKDRVGGVSSSQSTAPLESSRPSPSGPPALFTTQEPGSAEERIQSQGSQFTGEMREFTAFILDYEGDLSIDALRQLIRGQAQLPGRKTSAGSSKLIQQ